jgi:hypothetical protein
MASEEETRGELYHDIGEFTFQFSQLEYTIRAVLAGALELTDAQFDAVTALYDFRSLCEVACQIVQQAGPDIDGLHDRIRTTFNECMTLNNNRVHVAHGTWTVGPGNHRARHVSRQTLVAGTYFEDQGSVAALASEAQRLMGMIIEGFPEHPRRAATPPTVLRRAAGKTVRPSKPKSSKHAERKSNPER